MQTQRRAIEALHEFAKSSWKPKAFEGHDASFFLKRNRNARENELDALELLGISKGFGTCSDILGMNVAVLRRSPLN